MTQLGDSSKPSNSFIAHDGSGTPNQMAELYTAPVTMKIVTLGGWLGGWNQNAHCILAVWDELTGALLGASAEFIAANEGAASNSAVSQYVENLVTPIVVAAGTSIYVGTARDRSDGVNWATGSNAVHRYEATGAYPAGGFGSIGVIADNPRRIGQYIADYEPVAAAWVRRSGAWVQATSGQIERSGVLVDADGIQVMRSGLWVDAT